jgi:hypothetical protein
VLAERFGRLTIAIQKMKKQEISQQDGSALLYGENKRVADTITCGSAHVAA